MYGITQQIRDYALKKIDNQKSFLSSNSFQIGNDLIPMIQLFKNAYINSDKYIAEVNQRVFSLNQYASNHNLKPIFGTITLPSEYHKFKTLKNGQTVNNPRYANKNKIPLIDRIYDIKTKKHILSQKQIMDFTPHQGSKVLSKMFKNLLDNRFLKDIPKENKCYFRVYEPHQDGTPHLHFSLYVPENLLLPISQKIQKYFSKKYPNLKTDFQIDIKNPVSYLMKYILKTFDDLRENANNISDLSLWYIANKITRFYTSRTLMNLEVFRKLNGRYNLLELTYMFKSKELNYYVDIDTNKVLQIVDKYGDLYIKKNITLKNNDEDIVQFLKNRRLDLKENGTLKSRKKINFPEFKFIPILIDNIIHYSHKNQIFRNERFKTASQLTDNQLPSYYHHLLKNFDTIDNLAHFGVIKNEMIKRGFLQSETVNLNDVLGEYGF